MVGPGAGKPEQDVARLDREAREAQQRQDYARSIPLWDRLCSLCPDRWEYPLALGLDLSAAGRKAEADQILGKGARAHPQAMWLTFHWSLLALSENRLDVAEQRARKLLDHFPDDEKCFELLGDIAGRQRDMIGAERMFKEALRRRPESLACAEKLAFARLYSRLAQSFSPSPAGLAAYRNLADYAVLVINLDHNPERFAATARAFENTPAPLYRIPGIRGSYLPVASCRWLAGHGELKRGTLGAFLAHVAAWEVAAQLDVEHCLIIEDDASPIIDLPARLSALGIPDGFDLCFLNERMQCDIRAYDAMPAHFRTRSVIEALIDWPKDKNAPGADGYLLSREGARKLLTLVAQDGFAGDVDWRLVGYGVGRDEYRRLPIDSIVFDVLQKLGELFEGRVKAYTLFPCLIRTSADDSMRLVENDIATTAI